MRYLTLAEVVELHGLITRATGGGSGIRDLGALESAIAQSNADIVTGLEKVSCETMPERVARCWLGYSRGPDGILHRLLNHRFVQMMTAFDPLMRIKVQGRRGKYPLPTPITIRVRILPANRIRQRYPSGALP